MHRFGISVALSVALVAGSAYAEEGDTADSSGCGVGTILFKGQDGPAPQVLAITTNGTLGNQTFGITTGTLGCNQNGIVRSPAKVRLITTSSLDNLARDMARGEGETLDSLAEAMTIDAGDRSLFFTTMQANFARIFPSEDVTADEVLTSIHAVMAEDAELSRYAAV